MRKIFVLEFMSLDGVIQAPGGPEEDPSENFDIGGWTAPFFDKTSESEMLHQMTPAADLLLGRKTYDIFANFWPEHEDQWQGVNKATKYVVSNTLKDLKWENSVLISGDIVSELKKIKEGDGPDLKVWGSANLTQTLLKNDLVDELWLKIYPVTLGTGKRLFAEGTIAAAWELTKSKITESGVIYANYKRAGELKTGSFS